jgi:hypothetical protein
MTPPLPESVWLEMARQIPAVLAFLLIAGIIVQLFIKSIRSLTNDWMSFLQKQSEGTENALAKVALNLETMGTRIVDRLDRHDQAVETRVVNALQRYKGIERRIEERRLEDEVQKEIGRQNAAANKTTIKKRNKKRENST